MYFLTTFNRAIHINILDRKIISRRKLLEINQITKNAGFNTSLERGCHVFRSISLGETEEYWNALNSSYNYESNGFIVIIKYLPIMTHDKSYS